MAKLVTTQAVAAVLTSSKKIFSAMRRRVCAQLRIKEVMATIPCHRKYVTTIQKSPDNKRSEKRRLLKDARLVQMAMPMPSNGMSNNLAAASLIIRLSWSFEITMKHPLLFQIYRELTTIVGTIT